MFSETVIVCSVFTENFIYGQCIFWSNFWIGETHSLLATPPHVKFASLKTVLNEGGAFITVSLTAKKLPFTNHLQKKLCNTHRQQMRLLGNVQEDIISIHMCESIFQFLAISVGLISRKCHFCGFWLILTLPNLIFHTKAHFCNQK